MEYLNQLTDTRNAFRQARHAAAQVARVVGVASARCRQAEQRSYFKREVIFFLSAMAVERFDGVDELKNRQSRGLGWIIRSHAGRVVALRRRAKEIPKRVCGN